MWLWRWGWTLSYLINYFSNLKFFAKFYFKKFVIKIIFKLLVFVYPLSKFMLREKNRIQYFMALQFTGTLFIDDIHIWIASKYISPSLKVIFLFPQYISSDSSLLKHRQNRIRSDLKYYYNTCYTLFLPPPLSEWKMLKCFAHSISSSLRWICDWGIFFLHLMCKRIFGTSSDVRKKEVEENNFHTCQKELLIVIILKGSLSVVEGATEMKKLSRL